MAEKPWSAKAIRERCEGFRTALLKRDTATADEIAAYWPGGSVNQEPDPLGKWIFCYANLIRLLGRREPETEQAHVGAALNAALSNEPIRVTFADGSVRSVHAKSLHALRWLDTLDRSVRDVVDAVREYGNDPEMMKAVAVFPLIESFAVRLWAWILTEGRTPDETASLPFDENADSDPPTWTLTMAPEDMLALAKAHLAVNSTRLRIIAEAFPPEHAGESRLSLSGFLGTTSHEMGVQPSRLLRRWALGEIFAQSVSAAQASREATERAKAS